MNIILLDNDEMAQQAVLKLFGQPESKVSGQWVYSIGGVKSIAVFSVPNEMMFFDAGRNNPVHRDSQRARVVIWEQKDMYPKRGEKAEWNANAKDFNKAIRPSLTPQTLNHADAFVAFNRSLNLDDLDTRNIKPQIIGLSKTHLPPETEGRGGHVAYSILPQNRVVYPNNITSAPEEITTVWYGTSGPTNLAELLLTLAAGYKLNKPVKFDNYAEGNEALLGQMKMANLVKSLSQSLGIVFDLTLASTTEAILEKHTAAIKVIAWDIEMSLNHAVGLCNHPQQGQVATDSYKWLDQNGHNTIAQLHSKGYKFGGAVIYWAFYAMAKAGNTPFCALVYDGHKGAVHKLAIPWMSPPHGLWVCPAGNLKILRQAYKDQYEEFDIPWFLQTLEQTNNSVSVLTRLWEIALERVPLSPEKVGSKVVVLVGNDGNLEVISD